MKRRLKFLVVSGPTREPLDAVRYLSNYSTGVMGAALAAAVRRRGHRLTWVRCPEMAESARDLLRLMRQAVPKNDVIIMAAAVCDVRPVAVNRGKTKKSDLRSIRFLPNPDVLATLGRKKRPGQVFAGFALESENALVNAAKKLQAKNLDLILLQSVTGGRGPFGKTTVDAVLIRRDGKRTALPRATKARVAGLVVRAAEAKALSQESA